MTVIYRNFNSNGTEYNCPICLDLLVGADAVAHENGGEKHPIHRGCVQMAMAVNNLCPSCRVPTVTASLFSWKDRCICELKLIVEDMLLSTKLVGILPIAILVGQVTEKILGDIACEFVNSFVMLTWVGLCLATHKKLLGVKTSMLQAGITIVAIIITKTYDLLPVYGMCFGAFCIIGFIRRREMSR